MKTILLRSMGALIGIAYPFLVYFGIQRFNPAVFAVIIIIALAIRGYSSMAILNRGQIVSLFVLVTYSMLTAVLNSQPMLLFYPVVASISMACVFFISLRDRQPLLEKIAERMGEVINENTHSYLYWLTLIWGILLVANGFIASYTALYLSLKQWALYNGLISYLLLGGFFAVEFIFRKFYKGYKIRQDT